MPKHSKLEGVTLIAKFVALGQLMEYHVREEWLLEPNGSTSPAVDIAWFKDAEQTFPLFIFEIESAMTNSMTYNPMKVFTKPNEQLEKPLFFFQIVLSGGNNSTRVRDLKAQYGTYNYRIYNFSKNEFQQFLIDLISQHRRLTERFPISKFIDFVIQAGWTDIDVDAVIQHMEKIGVEKRSGLFLSSIVHLAAYYPALLPVCTKCIERFQKEYYDDEWNLIFHTFIGDKFFYPIHQGLIFHYNKDLYKKHKAFKDFQNWQEHNAHIKMIGPYFGLSQDYDQFLIWGTGGYFTLLVLLFENNPGITIYICQELAAIIRKSRPEYRIVNLAWLMHILPNNKDGEKLYRTLVLQAFAELKCFSIAHILNPPFLNDSYEYETSFAQIKEACPSFEEFTTLLCSIPTKRQVDVGALACRILTSYKDPDAATDIVVALLNMKHEQQKSTSPA